MRAKTRPQILPVGAATLQAACAEAAAIVRRGGIIAVPTESFYALGGDPTNPDTVERVCAIKGRPSDKPILILLAGQEQVAQFAQRISPVAQALMEAFWPGPLTLVLPAPSGVPRALTAGTGTLGLRWSAHPGLHTILTATGPLTGTSANRSGEPPSCRADEVARVCGEAVDLIMDMGPTPGGPPSTVIDVTGRPRLVREGALSAARLREMLARFGETLA